MTQVSISVDHPDLLRTAESIIEPFATSAASTNADGVSCGVTADVLARNIAALQNTVTAINEQIDGNNHPLHLIYPH